MELYVTSTAIFMLHGSCTYSLILQLGLSSGTKSGIYQNIPYQLKCINLFPKIPFLSLAFSFVLITLSKSSLLSSLWRTGLLTRLELTLIGSTMVYILCSLFIEWAWTGCTGVESTWTILFGSMMMSTIGSEGEADGGGSGVLSLLRTDEIWLGWRFDGSSWIVGPLASENFACFGGLGPPAMTEAAAATSPMSSMARWDP